MNNVIGEGPRRGRGRPRSVPAGGMHRVKIFAERDGAHEDKLERFLEPIEAGGEYGAVIVPSLSSKRATVVEYPESRHQQIVNDWMHVGKARVERPQPSGIPNEMTPNDPYEGDRLAPSVERDPAPLGDLISEGAMNAEADAMRAAELAALDVPDI